ncbi:MAG TPA: asparaginase domain-containing protein, partial [Syntrophomonadaceae bacterium]|nr:asparaginase domain-containing protein [Syntrophomonadaceae bacterium]
DLQEYKGIIVTHGTDTLPFTAAALSYLFKDIDIPLVITASNYPLGQPKSNGLRNFINSVDFIIQYSTPGVFVIFENNQGESIVYLGTRLVQAAPFTNEFDSPYAIFYGKMINGVFFENQHPFNPSLEDLRRPRRPFDCPQVNFSDKILYIKPVPGLNYQHYNFSKDKPRAVLHDLYHSGTACTREEKEDGGFSLIKFIDYCYDNAVDIYIAPIVGISGDIYASSRALIQRGAVPLSNISIEAALAKLMLLYGCFDDSELIKHMVNDEPLFFECLIPVNKK